MSGVMIVLMIAELIFSIGLGLVIATIHSVLLKFMAAQNDLAMAAKGSRDRIKARVDKLETEQAKTKRSIELTDQDVKFMSIELMMLSNHLILGLPLLLLPSVFPSIRVFSNESAFPTRWPKYWSFGISPSNQCSGLIFRIDWFDLLGVQETLKSLF